MRYLLCILAQILLEYDNIACFQHLRHRCRLVVEIVTQPSGVLYLLCHTYILFLLKREHLICRIKLFLILRGFDRPLDTRRSEGIRSHQRRVDDPLPDKRVYREIKIFICLCIKYHIIPDRADQRRYRQHKPRLLVMVSPKQRRYKFPDDNTEYYGK